MSLDIRLILTILFFLFLTIFILTHKKGRQMHVWKAVPIFYAVMYRTRFGLNFMDKTAKKYYRVTGLMVALTLISFSIILPTIIPDLGFLGNTIVIFSAIIFVLAGILIIIKPFYLNHVITFTGFYGMILIIVSLILNLIPLLTKPEAPPGAGLVLPVKGSGVFEGIVFFVPIEFWIISIFIIALVHEYAHGVLARKHNVKVKSSGFAFLGVITPVIPAAFVEPDEKILRKRPASQQFGVFAAGPFANFILAAFIIVIAFVVLAPLASKIVQADGAEITNFAKTSPAQEAGVRIGEVVKEIDGAKIDYVRNLSDEFQSKKPGETITVKTDKGSYKLTLTSDPENESRAYMGVFLTQSVGTNPKIEEKFGKVPVSIFSWFMDLLNFLIILNLGIGLFNLLPIGPLDGGRMLHTLLLKYFRQEKATTIFAKVSLFLLFVVLLNILVPIIRNIISNLG